MLRLILPIGLLVLGIGLGAGAGLYLGGGRDSAEMADAEVAPAEDHDTEDAGHGDVAAPGGSEFVRLNNQFVVPIVRQGSVRSLIIMALTVEVDSGQNETVFDTEPRLRDAFLRVMFAHANAGGFDGNFTEATAMTPLRQALAEAAHSVLGDVARDVLIVDITRQDA